MPDSPETPDPGLSPAQEQHVRRLLAEARHTEPTPDDVVARLDRVLADLADEPEREASVVHLADRRRRAGRMLVAAAAVLVLGVGVNEVVDGSGGSADSAESSPTAGDAAPEEERGAAQEDADGGAGSDAGSGAESSDATRTRPYRVSEDDFSRDVAALRAVTPRPVSGSVGNQYDGELSSGSQAATDRVRLRRAPARDVCKPGDWGDGGYVPVLYDRAAGWVVLRRPQGETQVLDLFVCGSEQAVRSVTLPVD